MPLFSFYRHDNGAFLASQQADTEQGALKALAQAGTDLSFADLRGHNLTGAQMVGAKLTSAKLDGAIADDANFQGATLTGAFLRGLRFKQNDKPHPADFRGSTQTGTTCTALPQSFGYGGQTFLDNDLVARQAWWNNLSSTQQSAIQAQFLIGLT